MTKLSVLTQHPAKGDGVNSPGSWNGDRPKVFWGVSTSRAPSQTNQSVSPWRPLTDMFQTVGFSIIMNPIVILAVAKGYFNESQDPQIIQLPTPTVQPA